VFEEPRALLRASFSFVAAAGLVVLTTVSQLASSSLSAGASLVLALPALFVAAFLVAVIVAPLLWGRARYRRLVRPLLGARPPFAPGLPARCRACGGDLPAPGGRDVFVACRFCATSNLLTADLAARAGRLDEEIALFQARAQGLQAHASGIGASMTRTFRIVLAIGVVGLAVASCLSSWLVTYFL
jgi:hypothetical protein